MSSTWTRRPDGKTIRRKSLRISGQFAPRCIDMLESPAYRVLTLAAHRVLARVEIELAHHGGLQNGELPVTYDQFQAYGVPRRYIGPAIHELISFGFIEVKRGRGGNAEHRRPNRFRLTFRPVQAVRGADVIGPTDDWKRFKTIDETLQVARHIKTETNDRRGHWPRSPQVSPKTDLSQSPRVSLQGQFQRGDYYLESWGGGGDGEGSLSSSVPVQSQDTLSLTSESSSSVVPFRRAAP
jgi:hypothetical protein